ncbi:hypothetical protein DYB32_008915 [Aphanomyces invadans]|uniref:Uncharacterized protein n=1 Tax=Aphanomyces invadans TaxID=157072 RepID=A0A3R6WG27_9STRA|nr:hypothetical protein DYB32_008915 [Aphanomyces invadans]
MDRANKVYQKKLKRFLDFLGRAEKLNDPNFAEANLLDVTPEEIRRYFNLKAFGTIAPTRVVADTCSCKHPQVHEKDAECLHAKAHDTVGRDPARGQSDTFPGGQRCHQTGDEM